MSELRMISDYKENDVYRLSFNELAKSVFGIEFEKYYRAGFWSDRYICFSYLDGEKVVSNVAVNKIDLVINGYVKKAIQIGTVMTDPEYRGKGLSKNLMETVINEYQNKCELFYLFANDSVLKFYPKFGFELQKEYTYYTTIAIEQRDIINMRKMNVDDFKDIELIKNMAKERTRLSQSFSTDNTEGILGWYCLNIFKDNVYLIEDLDAIVIFDNEDGKINLYDVLSKKEISFEQIIRRIADVGSWKVIFHFTPGFKDIEPTCEEVEHCKLFIRGGAFLGEVAYPITARA
ncbi:MAG: GNAT family N-acetyltransferase [Bacillota bacterium]|nr:GNAT family N-acetyltransferase [Bacillota bacterium]